MIGVSGGTSSGKTTVCQYVIVALYLIPALTLRSKIVEELNIPWAVLLSQDSFYKVLTPEQSAKAANSEYNFDHPGKLILRRGW